MGTELPLRKGAQQPPPTFRPTVLARIPAGTHFIHNPYRRLGSVRRAAVVAILPDDCHPSSFYTVSGGVCRPGSVTSTRIVCKSSSVSTVGSLSVTLKFGESALHLDDTFVYTENPVVIDIRPRAAFHRCSALSRSCHRSLAGFYAVFRRNDPSKFKPNSITLASSELAPNMFRTCS